MSVVSVLETLLLWVGVPIAVAAIAAALYVIATGDDL